MAMYCPDCDVKTQVLDTRVFDGDVLRKRKCPKCNQIIYTEEFISLDPDDVRNKIHKAHRNIIESDEDRILSNAYEWQKIRKLKSEIRR